MIELTKKDKAVLDAALSDILRGDKNVNINTKEKPKYIRGYDLVKAVKSLAKKFDLI